MPADSIEAIVIGKGGMQYTGFFRALKNSIANLLVTEIEIPTVFTKQPSGNFYLLVIFKTISE